MEPDTRSTDSLDAVSGAVSGPEGTVSGQATLDALSVAQDLECQTGQEKAAALSGVNRAICQQSGQGAGQHVNIVAGAPCRDVALLQIERNHLRVHNQDGADFTKGVWLTERKG